MNWQPSVCHRIFTKDSRYCRSLLLKGIETDYLTIDSVRQEGLWEKGNDYDFLIASLGCHYFEDTLRNSDFKFRNISSAQIKFRSHENRQRPVVSVGYTLRGGTTAFTPDFREADYLLRDEFEIADFGSRLEGLGYFYLTDFYPAGADVISASSLFPGSDG